MKLSFPNFLLIMMLVITSASCSQNPVKQIRSHTVNFYSGYKGDFRIADRTLFTKEFATIMDKAVALEKSEAAVMKASATPADKPRMIEGDVLCGLYEGYDKYEVTNVRDSDDFAKVAVELKNTTYNIKWTDTLVMVKQDGWKIDDIIYGRKQANASSARNIFSRFNDLSKNW